MAENHLQRSFESHAPALHEIARPGYTPVSISPLRTQRIEWNKHDYTVLLYSVALEDAGFEGLESYLLNSNTKTKMEGIKARGTNLDAPVLRVADINKDGKDYLIYIYSFDAGGYLVVEALVFKEEDDADGNLMQDNELAFALREFPDFNRLSGSSGGKALPVDVNGINAVIDAFIRER